jgi:8-oxo-dGTP pyrophosphatase MutT (NUDIX family)
MVAAIRPAGKPAGLWALPKGRIDEGESGEATALREVAEETGAHGRSLGKLGDVKYVYTWPPKPAEGERIFKVVSFFLVRYQGGRLGDVPEAFRHEVAEVKWLPLADAPRLLAYGGEKEMAKKALGFLENNAVEADV